MGYDRGLEEICPHCGEPQLPSQTDEHVAIAHADIPPCTATLANEHTDGTLRCVLRAGHPSGYGEHGDYHVSPRGPVGRTVWNDSAEGSTPHDAATSEA
ncbi:hypothetical protein HW846_46450 [Streptomyces sp. NE06-02F]|uniref:hypothetical protein n=1 Tax=Streptomyces caniscabiei TaxID=2746961 RepID=UPI0018731509|nr:hypothetical protein [Streptomyces caniscabiei]MBE4790688.1 hypothetical protein [Streptomyces caniscabiei]MDX2941020.1 hypothetical protein [Streptomyces caniscabiei]